MSNKESKQLKPDNLLSQDRKTRHGRNQYVHCATKKKDKNHLFIISMSD